MNKQIELQEAIEMLPDDDGVLGIGGVTNYRRPMAYALAVRAARPARRLRLLSFTAGLACDILVESGLFSHVRTCYFGLESFGLAPNFTQAVSEQKLEIVEESEASIAYGLRATLSGVGFMPSLAWQGTDLLKLRPDVKDITDPYTGRTLTAFPALHCDLAVIHALKADAMGNTLIGRNWGIDRELAYAAKKVLVTAEEIVPRLDRAEIDGSVIAAVLHAPRGAWPTSCHPEYPLDGNEFLRYVDAAGTESYEPLIDSWATAHFG